MTPQHQQSIQQYKAALRESRRISKLNAPTQAINRQIRKCNRIARERNEQLKEEARKAGKKLSDVELEPITPVRPMPFTLDRRSQSAINSELANRKLLEGKDASEWVSEIEKIADVPTRRKVGRIVWWDYFADRTPTNRTDLFDAYMERSTNGEDAPNHAVKDALILCGYSPHQADDRVPNIDYEINQPNPAGK